MKRLHPGHVSAAGRLSSCEAPAVVPFCPSGATCNGMLQNVFFQSAQSARESLGTLVFRPKETSSTLGGRGQRGVDTAMIAVDALGVG